MHPDPFALRAAKVPFERTYWAVPGKLLAGCYPGASNKAAAEQKLGAMINAGVRTEINLMEPAEKGHDGKPFVPYEPMFERLGRAAGQQVTLARFPIKDMGIPTTHEMRKILDAISASLGAGRPVYVHCWGGKGRTGTVVGCYLIEAGLATPATVLDDLNKLRAVMPAPYCHEDSPQTDEQRRFVVAWTTGGS